LKRIEIYTEGYCPYCQQTKELLESKKVPFVEYNVTNDPVKKQAMRRRSGRQTVPEIFIDEVLVGGCDDLFALEAAISLDQQLSP
jgi:glutaredoxin 3